MKEDWLDELIARLGAGARDQRSARARWSEASHADIQKQIAAEKASALSRAVEKLADAVSEALSAADDASPEGLARYEALRQQAIRARWELRVHREALGLVRHDDVDRLYPIPPRRG